MYTVIVIVCLVFNVVQTFLGEDPALYTYHVMMDMSYSIYNAFSAVLNVHEAGLLICYFHRNMYVLFINSTRKCAYNDCTCARIDCSAT